MKPLILLLLVLLPVCAWSSAPEEPSFDWGSKCSPSVRAILQQAQARWREASAAPSSPDCLKIKGHALLDEPYLYELLRRDDRQVPYSLLDSALSKLDSLEKCRLFYQKAVKAAGKAAPSPVAFDNLYYLLASRIRLAAGMSRASISQRMAAPDTSNYSFQAMESAIDTLRDAAEDARKSSSGELRAKRIRDLRSSLLSAWEQAQRIKDSSALASIDLADCFKKSGLLSAEQAKSCL